MSLEENKAITRRFVGGWNEGDLKVFDDICAAEFVYYDPGNPDIHNLVDYKQFVIGFRAAYPDYHITIEDTIAEGNKVAVRATGRGTNRQTGKHETLISMNIVHLVQHKVAEYWCTWIWETQG